MKSLRIFVGALLVGIFGSPVFGAFYASPVQDLPYLDIRHSELPGQTFRWRVPEYVGTCFNPTIPHNITWTRKDSATWTVCWDTSDEVKAEFREDYTGEVIFGVDTIDFNMTITNPTASLANEDYWIISLICGQAPEFHDLQGQRTYIRREGKFITVSKAIGESFEPQCMGTFNMNVPKDSPRYNHRTDAPFIARVSKDGKWVVATGGAYVSSGPGFNLNPGTSCLNVNHSWGRLKPGEKKSASFRVYIIKGGLDDVWRRYVRDFGSGARKDVGRADISKSQVESGTITIDGLKISAGQSRRADAVPSVWAPATELKTLAALHAKRPAACESDKLLCWIADVAIRDNQNVSPAFLKAERAKFKSKGSFTVRDDETGLWLSNDKVGLRFLPDGEKCGLVSFYDLNHGIELLSGRAENASPFRIQVLRYREDGTTGVLHFAQAPAVGPDLSFLVEVDAQNAASALHNVKISLGKAVVTLKYSDITVPDTPGELNAAITMVLDADDTRIKWRSKVDGELPRAGISQVRCPVLPRLGYSAENDFLYAWGSQRGIFKRGDTSVSNGTYPSSQWSMQHFSISFGPEVSLYVACHDPDSYVKWFQFNPGNELVLSAYVPDTGVMGNATYSQPYDVVVGPIEGDWFDSAKLYRKWATANAPWASKPLKDRKDICHRMLKVGYWVRCSYFHDDGSDGEESWSFDQAMWRVGTRESVEWYKRVLDIPYERLGGIHYGWQSAMWDTHLPYWSPFGSYPSEELKRQTDLGMSTVAYMNPCWWDAKAYGWPKGAKESITRNIDGAMYFEQYNAKMYEINRSTQLFRDVLKRLAKQLRSMGSNGIYYDQFSGLIRGGDYDSNKGLPNLGKGGNWLPKARQRAIREVRELMGPEFGFVSEFYCETNQHLFDVHSVTLHSDPMEGALIPAVYSGYIVQYGAGLHHKTQPVASIIALGKNYLWGTSFGWTQFCTELKRNYSRLLLKQLVQLRIQLDDFLVYGEMIRPPRFVKSTPTIDIDEWIVYGQKRVIPAYDAYEASMWRADDGRRALLLMNYDNKRHQVEFNIADIGSVSQARIKLLEPSNGAKLSVANGRLVVETAPRSGAAIVLPRSY